jgi:hypothetical protein
LNSFNVVQVVGFAAGVACIRQKPEPQLFYKKNPVVQVVGFLFFRFISNK